MSAEQIEQRASLWLAREDRGLTAQERAALDAWLGASSLNKVAYLRLKAAWQRADRLAALKRPPMRLAVPANRLAPALRLSAFAAAVLGILYAGMTYLEPDRPREAVYASRLGQVETYRLADGTRMALNTGTRVRASLGAGQRVVRLETGEAYFEVAHDARHPFMVLAGNRRITDLGTKFSVFLDGDTVRVVVREGRVRVDMQPVAAGIAPVVADAGHEVIARGPETLLLAKTGREIDGDLGWRAGMLVFEQLPLTDVAQQFNRYNSKHILVEGSAGKIRIGGSFRADNVDAFLQLLHQGFGLTVKERGDRVVVSR